MAQEYSEQYKQFMTVPQIPGSPDFRTIEDFFSNRQFGDIRGGLSSKGIMGAPQIMPQEIIGEEKDQGYDFTMPEEKSYIERITDYISDPSKNVQRGLGTLFLTANPIAALASYFAPNIMDAGGGIFDAFKNFQDRRKGRLDITSDFGIMPTGREIGAATTADYYGGSGDDGGRSDSAQSFSESQSYGGGGTMGDLGADTF